MTNQCQHGQLARVCLTCEQAAEIERLTRELANARAADIHSCGPTCTRAGCVNGRLRAQVAALEVDWNVLCGAVQDMRDYDDAYCGVKQKYRDAIDAALAARKGEA